MGRGPPDEEPIMLGALLGAEEGREGFRCRWEFAGVVASSRPYLFRVASLSSVGWAAAHHVALPWETTGRSNQSEIVRMGEHSVDRYSTRGAEEQIPCLPPRNPPPH